MSPYEQHRQNQFHAPLSETGGAGLCSATTETIYCSWPASEPCVVMSESEARRLVAGIDNCRWSDVFFIIKRQPWFKEIRAGVRTTRHLKPVGYLKLSERTSQLPTS